MPDLRKLTIEHMAIVARIKEMFPDEDEESLADTIEGASDIKEAIIVTLRQAREAEAMVRGLEAYTDMLGERAKRWEARSERLRAAALQAATDTGNMKLIAPDFTASVSPGKRKLIIMDEAAVPDSLCLIKREPNKTAIMEAIEAGEQLEWATLSNRQPFWTVRTK